MAVSPISRGFRARRFRFMLINEPGFREEYGDHEYGDPWREQRYVGD
jgi:DMSO/TMAO reductase YedYZ molybdopterin-dependent catalytic subunit